MVVLNDIKKGVNQLLHNNDLKFVEYDKKINKLEKQLEKKDNDYTIMHRNMSESYKFFKE